MPCLIVLGSPESGRSTFAYDMTGVDAIKSRFDSHVVVQTVEDAVRMTRGKESAIVLIVDYPRFTRDEGYRRQSIAAAASLRKKNLKFIVVANKINDIEESPTSARKVLSRDFPDEPSFVYDGATSVPLRLPAVGGEIARQAISAVSRAPLEAGVPSLGRENRMYLTHAEQNRRELDANREAISNALTSADNTNSPSLELTGIGGVGIKASGPIVYPFIVIVSFALVFLTLNQMLPNIKNDFTEAIFVLALVVGTALLVFVGIQSYRLTVDKGNSRAD